MDIVVIKQAQRELADASEDVRQDIFALFDDLAAGKMLGLPVSRPLPMVAKGLHELRLSYRGGEFRVFYVIRVSDSIYVIHAAQKKKQEIDRRTKELLQERIRRLSL